MSLEITNVENGDTPITEKVWVKANKDVNTKGYALVDKTFDEKGNPSNEFRHIYIFPSLDLKKGEVVVVRTGKGKDQIKKFTDTGNSYHALYWNSDHCVWNKDGDLATLIRFEVIDTFKVPAKK